MGMPHAAGQWTATRVRALPDDGQRHEFIDGAHVVTPAPGPPHQIVLRRLFAALEPCCTASGIADLLWSPADLALGEDEILQPDLFVYRTVSGQPLTSWRQIRDLQIVIEVLSPSTAQYDRGLKRRRYQRARVPEYWIVDIEARAIERWRPDATEPEVITDRLGFRLDRAGTEYLLDVAALFADPL